MKNKERPILADLVNAGTLDIEKFQNEIIRPIIKMQHHLLVASFQNYLQKRKIDFSNLTEQKKRSRISSIYKTDNNFKNLTLGFIIGHFSLDEFAFYTANISEVHKRVLQITTQRIKDSILELKL
ncbi:glyoxalase [Polaribacter glomeratus]|uniref:Glyoxalase n=1 Tax=Polaribacter glomeratus TaxID=102 RepID=A0A2S7WUR4_9FLAO|nr:glyoxalase [Polaribacter glomeratus]PQJ81344.1 glyoxalase [Polaribacter glomeratus]TXD64042.1 glyoxalase [Polaribacter glomeratus]